MTGTRSARASSIFPPITAALSHGDSFERTGAWLPDRLRKYRCAKAPELSGEHFCMDGTLIQAWGGHKSFVRKDNNDDQDPGEGGNFKGETRGNETHESKSDPDSRLYRKGKTASELRYMGHTLSDNRHGLIDSAVVTLADGYAEREAAKC